MISGGNGEEVPPVPIPNTEVKLFSADDTWLDTARESRSPPDSIRIAEQKLRFPIFLSSSMAEHSAVNRVVVGSSPTWGARKSTCESKCFFVYIRICASYYFVLLALRRAFLLHLFSAGACNRVQAGI